MPINSRGEEVTEQEMYAGYTVDPDLAQQYSVMSAAEDTEREQKAQQAESEPAPTGEQQVTQPTQQDSTEPAEEDKGVFGNLVDNLKGIGRDVVETNLAVPMGVADWSVESANALNKRFFGPDAKQYSKLTPFENKNAEMIRAISSVVAPTIGLASMGQVAGAAAHARVGWALGNSKFVQFMGNRGVEQLASLGVGLVSDQYTGQNLSATVSEWLPEQFDFIPDNWKTIQDGDPDLNRIRNINEDQALGFAIPMVGALGKAINAQMALRGGLKKLNKATQIVGETPQAKAALEALSPDDAYKAQARAIYANESATGVSFDDLPPEVQTDLIAAYKEGGQIIDDDVIAQLSKQELKTADSLREFGELQAYRYGDNENIALKGVHDDLFENSELGIRNVDDFGVVGAAVDAARITDNLGTVNGRLRSMASEPVVTYASKTPGAETELIAGLADQLKVADKFGAVGDGFTLTADQIAANGDMYVNKMIDSSLDLAQTRQLIEPLTVRNSKGKVFLLDEGYAAMFGADPADARFVAQANAYFQTSLAGQVSDLAEGIRLNNGSLAKAGNIKTMADKLELLQKLSGLNKYYADAKAKAIGALKAGQDPMMVKAANDATIANVPAKLDALQKNADNFEDTIEWLQKNEPEMLDGFLELYEASDGQIDTIAKMTEDINNSFTRWRVLYDEAPSTSPNLLSGAMRANFMNSLLSNPATSASALIGNLGGLVMQPASYFAGAVMARDWRAIQDGWMAYSAVFDTSKKALPYAGKMFAKAAQNADDLKKAGGVRADLILKQEEKLAAYKKIAKGMEAQGNYGLSTQIQMYENMMDLANDPIFRFNQNTFTGFDGMARASIANAEARFMAIRELREQGAKLDPQKIKDIANQHYNDMFDASGEFIVDKAVKYQSNEIALNLKTPFTDGLDKAMARVPLLRAFTMFPTMTGNILKSIDDVLPYSFFQKDLQQLALTPMKDIMSNPQFVDDVLTQRGYTTASMTPGAKLEAITRLRHRTLGKKAVGGLVVAGVSGLIVNNKITGDGFYDKETNLARIKNSNWKARTIEIGGKRIPYEPILGPGLSNWLATFVNIHDNFDKLGETNLENMRRKMMFILGASLTDDAGVSAIRPLVEMLSGNDFAWTRWSAGMLNSMGPLGGARKAMSDLLDPGLKEVNYELQDMLANKNSMFWLDESNRLPYTYNPLTGAVPNKYDMLSRLWNAVNPIKIHPGQTDEEKFLQEIEWDYSTAAKTHKGVPLEPAERSEILRLMGEQGFFRDEVKRISKLATTRDTIKELQKARDAGYSAEQVPLKHYDAIHLELANAQRTAEQLALNSINPEMRQAIDERLIKKSETETLSQQGIIMDVLQMRK